MAIGAFFGLSAVHLVSLALGRELAADVSQVTLMPPLAVALATAVPAPRAAVVRRTLLALGFSWLGDTLPRFAEGDTAFLLMVGSFMVAQGCYIAAFAPWRDRSVLRRRALLAPYVIAIGGLVAACGPYAGPLLVPVFCYGLLLGTMAVLASGVNRLTWVGGAVFLVSDALIALDAFAPWWHLPGQSFWVMSTYLAAQTAIVAGVVRAADR